MNIRKDPKTYTYRIEDKMLWRKVHHKKGNITLDEAITTALKEWVENETDKGRKL